MLRHCFILISIYTISCLNFAVAGQEHVSAYVGEENRVIKSLSDNDIQQLRNGKGWGLAKVAELNGVPGPAHILQMKDEISLGKEQEAKFRSLYEQMKSKAIPLGIELIELEKQLNAAFADNTITDKLLVRFLDSIAQVRMKLRYVHLSSHLMAPEILTTKQITQYNRLRGYNSADPCKNIPIGHDKKMWRKHNGCS